MALSVPQKRKLWSKESMVAAVKSVEDGMGIREAARLYNIPFETLRRRTNNDVSMSCRSGPPTVLTSDEEQQLASYCIKMADMGFGLSREDVMMTAFRIVESSGRKHPFTNGIAGRAWFDLFRTRHPSLTLRTPQPLSRARAACANEETVSDYFAKLGAICAKLNVLMKPMQIYNMDETGVSIVHKPGKVLTELGRRNVWAVTSAEKGKTHTILTCVSASGNSLPPFMIYPRKRITDNLKVGALAGTSFNCTDNGWVNGEMFCKWFNFFVNSIPPPRPVLLILDGHASHVSIEVIELARCNQIHMLCLPSHTTHILQPLDVGVFKSLKANYSKACRKYISENPGRVVTTEAVASLLAVAWPLSVTPVNIMAGFKKCGIYPLNPGEVTDRQIAPSKAVCVMKDIRASMSPPESTDMQASCNLGSDRDSIFEKRYSEGYDIYSEDYVAWLQVHHPQSIPPNIQPPPPLSDDTHSNCSGEIHQHSTSSKYKHSCFTHTVFPLFGKLYFKSVDVLCCRQICVLYTLR